MAYARFGHCDVYVFMSTSGHLECCGCILGDDWSFDSTQAMVDHLAEHRAAGHDVPDGIEDDLWEDDRENWIDYPRCDAEGCDLRVTCGSPTDDGGYVSCCSIAHAQTIGGFTNFPRIRDGEICTCECSPPEFGGSLLDRDCPVHNQRSRDAEGGQS